MWSSTAIRCSSVSSGRSHQSQKRKRIRAPRGNPFLCRSPPANRNASVLLEICLGGDRNGWRAPTFSSRSVFRANGLQHRPLVPPIVGPSGPFGREIFWIIHREQDLQGLFVGG